MENNQQHTTIMEIQTTLYVDPMQGHLRFALIVNHGQSFMSNYEIIGGTVKDFKGLDFLMDAALPDETLINGGYRGLEVKAFSEAHGIPYPPTLEQRARIDTFTRNTPQP